MRSRAAWLSTHHHVPRCGSRAQVMYHSLSLVIPDDGATDEALQALVEIAKQHPDSVPLALAIATGYVKLGSIPRARTHLKRAQVTPPLPSPRASLPAFCAPRSCVRSTG